MGIEVKATEGVLSELHCLTAEYMKQRLTAAQSGELQLPPAELSAIIKFLKDNGIECTREDMQQQFNSILHLNPPTFGADEIEASG